MSIFGHATASSLHVRWGNERARERVSKLLGGLDVHGILDTTNALLLSNRPGQKTAPKTTQTSLAVSYIAAETAGLVARVNTNNFIN